MSNLSRFKKGLLGDGDEIVAALKAEFGDDHRRVMSFLAVQADVSLAYNKFMRRVVFGAGFILGLWVVVIVGWLT
jgi:hypothetical protein